MVCCDISGIKINWKKKIYIVDDCAQAHGSKIKHIRLDQYQIFHYSFLL